MLFNEDLIIFIRCDVGLVDVVIFDCYYIMQLIVYILVYVLFCVLQTVFYGFMSICQICLILAEATAIGIRLSHASRMNLYSWRTAQ